MKKMTAFLLILALMLSTGLAFGTEMPKDISKTKCEAAVSYLIEKGIVTGYPDGTFRPQNTISRAEACIVVVKSMAPGDEDLAKASDSGFSDVAEYGWAAEYINYARSKGIISGYPDGSFRPAKKVSYSEMAKMLVSSLGFYPDELEGAWPDNYVSKAEELGIFSDFSYTGGAQALRGHAAMMVFALFEKSDEEESKAPRVDYGKLAGPLAAYSGRAYGMVLDTASILNKDGDVVKQLEFLFGKDLLYLNAEKRFNKDMDLFGNFKDGNLFGLKMRGGIVQDLDVSSTSFAAIGQTAGFEDFTEGSWAEVTSIKNSVVTVMVDEISVEKSILDDASIYVATYDKDAINGYKGGSIRDIREGCFIRLYSVTGKNPKVVEVAVVKKAAAD
jgi:hypothetical protein